MLDKAYVKEKHECCDRRALRFVFGKLGRRWDSGIHLLSADESRLLIQGAMDSLHFTGICFRIVVVLYLSLSEIR